MRLLAETDVDFITFHSDELTITSLEILDSDMNPMDIGLIIIDFQRTLISLHLTSIDMFTQVSFVQTALLPYLQMSSNAF